MCLCVYHGQEQIYNCSTNPWVQTKPSWVTFISDHCNKVFNWIFDVACFLVLQNQFNFQVKYKQACTVLYNKAYVTRIHGESNVTLSKGNVRGSRGFFLLNAGFHQNFTLRSFLCTDKFLVNRTENNSHGDFTEMFYL